MDERTHSGTAGEPSRKCRRTGPPASAAVRALRRANRFLRTLGECRHRMVRALEEPALLHDVCDELVAGGGYRLAWIGYAEQDEHRSVQAVACSDADAAGTVGSAVTWADEPRGRGPTGTAIRTQRPALCRDLLRDPAFAPWREEARQRGHGSALALPLGGPAKLAGALTVHAAQADAFSADEIKMLADLADDLAFRIATLRRRQEREAMGVELRESETRLLEAQELGRMGNWQLDLATNVLTWSHEIYRIFEIDPRRFGASYEAFLDAVHPEDRARVNQAYTESVRNRTPYEITHRLRMPDGREKFVHERGQTFYDDRGQAVRSIGTVQDITERVRAEQAIETERQRLRGVLENLPVFLVLRTPDRRFAFANRFFRDRFGEARGQHCYEHLFGRSDPCPNCESFHVLQTNSLHKWQWVGPDRREYAMFDLPFTDTDGTKLVLEVGLDVTDARRAEREIRELNTQLEARVRERTAQLVTVNRELEAFAYSVSHDLRTPLRGIDGFSRILQRDFAAALGDRGREHLQRVRAATRRMDQLIDQLLRLSRTARAPFRRLPLDLTALARSIALELEQVEPSRRVAWAIESNLAATGDPVLMRTVLENLLGNAWKFTGRKADARIEVGLMPVNGERVFFVRDDGAGFDMEYGGKLFRAFQRLHADEEFPGSGIGLATVQRIIQRHGGKVWAEGRVDAGATFFFTLPGAGAETTATDDPL